MRIMLPLDKRQMIARDCLHGSNVNRQSIAAEILSGDLFTAEGLPKTYWHCLATMKPPPKPGRLGEWKAEPCASTSYGREFDWWWQDWGATPIRR